MALSFLLGPAIVTAILASLGIAVLTLRRFYPENERPLIDTVEAMLPQTQCAQCGYTGCRPYAEALVDDEVATNLCPPGGEELYTELAALLDRTAEEGPPSAPQPSTAAIREIECIGCALCLPACPVDAIVGASGQMHTVIGEQCTGCELCVPACPVDCIDMHPIPPPVDPRTPAALNVSAGRCIHCGRCDPVCPKSLEVHKLVLSLAREQVTVAEQLRIEDCIECQQCDRVCPSNIPLAAHFGAVKLDIEQANAAESAKRDLQRRYHDHQRRLLERQQKRENQREARLKERRQTGNDW